MPDATCEAEYHLVAKLLHWMMFLFLAAQFVVGYAIDREDDLLAWAVDAWLAGEEEQLLGVHAGLGLALLLLAILRALWRSAAGLPPWSPGLSDRERRVVHHVEQALYATMFHIATHLTFFGALAVHIGMVLKHQFIDRDRLLRRML